MPAIGAYWLLITLAGLTITDAIPFPWKPVERAAAALAVGLVCSTVASFLLALGTGLWGWTGLVGALFLVGVFAGARWRVWWTRCQPDWLWAHWHPRASWPSETIWAIAVASTLGLAFWLLFRGALYPGADGTLLANSHVWADWAVHASYAQSFLLGHNLPPQDILESGTSLRYPFLVDFQPPLLEALGQNLWGSLDMSSFAICWAATVLIWHLALRVTARPATASVAIILVLLGGGLGFAALYPDGCQQLASTTTFRASSCTELSTATPGAVVQFAAHLPAELTHLPRSYDGEGPAVAGLPDLQWYEPLLVYWMPQRDFAYGMALVTLVALLLWEAVRTRARGLLPGAGAIGAALPFFNPFGYLLVGLLGVWWLGRRRWGTGLVAYLLPLLVLGLPQLWFVISGPHGALGGPVGTNLFPQLDLGWLAHSAVACTAVQFRAGASCDTLYLTGASPRILVEFVLHVLREPSFYAAFAGFWISNTGVFTLLALLLTLLSVVPNRLRDQIRVRELTSFWAPFWLVFLLANLIVTQPWNWDNTKLLSYWYLGASIPLAWLLTSAKGAWMQILAGVAVLSLVLAGALSLDAAFLGQSNFSQSPPTGASDTFASAQAQRIAAVIREKTSPRAVFLTEGQPNDPVTTLAGRPVMLAYDGWLWSYGRPLTRRFQAVQTIYAGCEPNSPCAVGALLQHYGVQYIEFEPGDYNHILVNLNWFQSQHLPVLVRTANYVIFKVTSLW